MHPNDNDILNAELRDRKFSVAFPSFHIHIYLEMLDCQWCMYVFECVQFDWIGDNKIETCLGIPSLHRVQCSASKMPANSKQHSLVHFLNFYVTLLELLFLSG